MTQLGLSWLQHQETVRANQAREKETKRSNLASEVETNRSNVARETETNRHNLATEQESVRSNRAQEDLKRATNLVNQTISQLQLSETERHNRVTEVNSVLDTLYKHSPELLSQFISGGQLIDFAITGTIPSDLASVLVEQPNVAEDSQKYQYSGINELTILEPPTYVADIDFDPLQDLNANQIATLNGIIGQGKRLTSNELVRLAELTYAGKGQVSFGALSSMLRALKPQFLAGENPLRVDDEVSGSTGSSPGRDPFYKSKLTERLNEALGRSN